MTYPDGYGAAEHRRALDALLADIAKQGEPRPPEPAPKRAAPRPARVLDATSATGQCNIELLVNADVIARA
jgi:hypothetical protein